MPQGDQMTGSKSNGSGDVLFSPIQLGPLEVKNRLFRSNISGRFDNYDGSGTPGAHQLGSEVRARRRRRDHLVVRAGARCAAASCPNYATIDHDDKIPFWRELGEAVHEHDCRYILQLSHAGRAARHPRRRVPDGAELDRASRSRCTASSASAMTIARDRESGRRSSPRARAARARPGSTASSCTAPTAT